MLNNQQWEQVNAHVPHTTTHHDMASKNEYSLRSISRKRNEKGVTKRKLETRENSINSVLQDKKLVLIPDDHKHNETTTARTKKIAASS